jgi:hypothetical protein
MICDATMEYTGNVIAALESNMYFSNQQRFNITPTVILLKEQLLDMSKLSSE